MASGLGTFKKIDHYFGLPICVALSLWYGLWRFVARLTRRPAPTVASPKRVLLIKFFGLGSIGYATVIVRDLRREFPGVRVTLLTFAENRRFAEFLQQFDEIRTIDKRGPLTFLCGTLGELLYHLGRPYDVCIDLEYFSKFTTMLTAFTRAPVRIGFYSFSMWRRFIYTRHTYFNTAKHVRRIYGLAAEMAGVAQSQESPAPIQLPPAHLAAATEILKRHGWDGAPFVGVNVNASDLALGRRWPVERYAEIVERVAERGYGVFLTGAPAEHAYTQSCLERVNPAARAKVRNLAGQFDILQFLAFLKLARLFVSNDSGPMIFAILLDAPSVTLWGPGDPAMYGGEPPRHRYVYSRYPCSPCMYIPNTDAGYFCNHRFPCMPAIRTDQVADEVFAALQES